MLTDRQKDALNFAVFALKQAGITAWFEARIIKDSDKKLNGRRISSKKRTDLESVLKVVESKRVGMLPDMRMELRMYATAASSRAVFMGQELVIGIDLARPGSDSTAMMQGTQLLGMEDLRQRVKEGSISDSEAAMRASLLTATAHYSPAKNVERLRAEGVAEDDPIMKKAKRRVVREALTRDLGSIVDFQEAEDIPGFPSIPDAPLARMRVVATHTCDAAGPMRQRDQNGPFVTTCSLCGELNE
jgi:hypothetical protein